MSRKTILQEKAVIDENGFATLATGDVTTCENLDAISYEIDWSNGSSFDAVAFIQYSNNNTDWKNLDFGASLLLYGASGNHKVDVDLIIFKYIRPWIIAASGSCDLTVKIKGTTKGA